MVLNHKKRSDICTFCFLQANNVPDSCKRERLVVVKVEQIEQWEIIMSEADCLNLYQYYFELPRQAIRQKDNFTYPLSTRS